MIRRAVPHTAGRRRPKRKPGFAARVVDVVYKFVRRVLSLAAAMGTYDDTFVSPYELQGTGLRAKWPVIEAGDGEVLVLKEEDGPPGEVFGCAPGILCRLQFGGQGHTRAGDRS